VEEGRKPVWKKNEKIRRRRVVCLWPSSLFDKTLVILRSGTQANLVPTITIVGVYLPLLYCEVSLSTYLIAEIKDARAIMACEHEEIYMRHRAEQIQYYKELLTHVTGPILSIFSPAIPRYKHATPPSTYDLQDFDTLLSGASNTVNVSGLVRRRRKERIGGWEY
jgi:hypothetical protein